MDVGQRAMGEALLGLAEVDARIPAAAQLLDGADVDHPVVQVVVELGHVTGDEAAVCGDRVAGQGGGLGLLDVGADVVEHQLLGRGHVDGRRAHLLDQPRAGVHLGDDRDHRGQHGVVGVDHHVDAVAQDVEVGVGDQHRDLDEPVGLEVKAGHLTVDPHQFVTHRPTLSRRPTTSRPHPPGGAVPSNVRAMTTESTATPAQQIAAGYATQGPALELGAVVVDGACDPTAQVRIPLATVNRHGLVAGATGTGKTKSLQVIAEQLSAAGVPVMMADVKGDLSGLSRPGVGQRQDRAAGQGHRRRLDSDGLPGRVHVAGHHGHRRAGARDDHQLRADPAVEGVGAQPNSGVDARADLSLGRSEGFVAARPQGPAGGHPVPDQRRGQAGAEGARRGVADDRRRDPAGTGQPRGRRRRHVLRRARAGAEGPDAGRCAGPRRHHVCSRSASRPPGR